MARLEPIETDVKGIHIEKPFKKFQIEGSDLLFIVDKEKDKYLVRIEDNLGNIEYPRTEFKGEFWRKKRTVSGLVKELNELDISKEFDSTKFRLDIANALDEQLELHTELEIQNQEYVDEQLLEEKYDSEIIEKAEEMLEEKHILKYVKTVLDHKIAGEDRNKVALFLQLLTKDFEEPLMVFGVQKQGEGKSYLLKSVLDLFPDEMVEDLTDATKASIYRIAEDEGSTYFKDKIVYFGEIPEEEDDREVFQVFRQLVSEGEVNKRLTMDKGEGLESHELHLEGAPCMATTTTDPDRIDKQDLSRGVTFSPSMSDRQYEAVREYQNREEEIPEDALEPQKIKELEKVIKCCIEIIADNEVEVRNPFARDIDELVPERTANIKRDYPKVMRIVGRVPTYLYYRQRPEAESGGTTYKLTTWKDVIRGLWINKDFINGMLEGRVEATLDVLQEIKKKVEPVNYSYDELEELEADDEDIEGVSFTNADVEKWTGINSDTVYNYTRKLEKLGFIYKDKRSRPNKQYLVEEGKTENGGITPRALKVILEAFIEEENVRNWADFSLKFYSFEGDKERIIEKVGLSEEDIPENEDLEIDLGLFRSSDYPTPVYMQNSRIKSEVANSLILSKEDANISLRFGGVSKTFTLFDEANKEEDVSRSGMKEKDQEVEKPKDSDLASLYDQLNQEGGKTELDQVTHLVPGAEEVEILDGIRESKAFETFKEGNKKKVRVCG
ncbi:MAG: hypothetical protein ABEJ36_02930 [Candidatus Nanosalina sp.]